MAKNKKKADNTICKNRKAWHDYEIIKTYEAGIVLNGNEIKSIRQGSVNLKDAYAKINHRLEMYVINMYIANYAHAHLVCNLDERCSRKLLLHKKELKELAQNIKEHRYTLIPLSLYYKNNYVKVQLGLCKGKKLYDKRQALKTKDQNREIDKMMKKYLNK